MERLDKLLGGRGAGSRQEVRRLCKQRRVTVDGAVVTDYERKFSPDADIRLNGEPVVPLPRLVRYHKPLDVISTMQDDWGRDDLAEVLPEPWRGHLHPVGRLDADTTGLLLFSSDGALTQRLLHPRRAVEREYIATVEGAPDDSLIARLAAGVTTADGVIPAQVVAIEGDTVRLIVTEGKHRMVRRLLANAGHPVVALHRVRYGGVTLGPLEVGQVEAVRDADLAWLDDPHATK